MWTIRHARPDERKRLHAIWKDAVRATHGFISEQHFRLFSRIVRDEMLPLGGVWVAAGAGDRAVAWMQLDGPEMEVLVVDPRVHRRGAGRALVEHALTLSPKLELDASERSGAVAFYLRLGFVETGRSEADGMEIRYPLVHMRFDRAR